MQGVDGGFPVDRGRAGTMADEADEVVGTGEPGAGAMIGPAAASSV